MLPEIQIKLIDSIKKATPKKGMAFVSNLVVNYCFTASESLKASLILST